MAAPRRRARPRRTWESYAAPLAFLLAATVAVLLVRSALHGRSQAPPPATPSVAVRPAKARPKARPTRTTPSTTAAAARFYVVQAGDSFGAIAAKTGTTVAEIERLNPGVSSTTLHIGQKLRVG